MKTSNGDFWPCLRAEKHKKTTVAFTLLSLFDICRCEALKCIWGDVTEPEMRYLVVASIPLTVYVLTLRSTTKNSPRARLEFQVSRLQFSLRNYRVVFRIESCSIFPAKSFFILVVLKVHTIRLKDVKLCLTEKNFLLYWTLVLILMADIGHCDFVKEFFFW